MTIPYTQVKIPLSTFQSYATATNAVSGQPVPVTSPIRERLELNGEKNPEWKRSVVKHENASTPLTAYHEQAGKLVPVFAYARRKNKVGVEHLKSVIYFSGVIPRGLDYSAINWNQAWTLSGPAYSKAFQKLMSKMRGDFRALTTAGEMKEALRMLRSPFATLARKLDGVHDRNIKHFRKYRLRGTVKAQASWNLIAAEAWLEFNFGLSPLLQDIENAADTFITCFDDHRKVVTAKARKIIRDPYIAETGYDFWRFETRGDKVSEVGWSITSCTVTRPQERPTIYNSGLSIADLVPTAWELVPFSFIFDYFIPLGSYLDAQATWVGAPIVWSTATERSLVKVVGSSRVFTDPSPISGAYHPPLGRCVTTTFHSSKRIVRQPNVVIEPRFHPSVDFVEKFNMSRGLNLASLTRALVGYR